MTGSFHFTPYFIASYPGPGNIHPIHVHVCENLVSVRTVAYACTCSECLHCRALCKLRCGPAKAYNPKRDRFLVIFLVLSGVEGSLVPRPLPPCPASVEGSNKLTKAEVVHGAAFLGHRLVVNFTTLLIAGALVEFRSLSQSTGFCFLHRLRYCCEKREGGGNGAGRMGRRVCVGGYMEEGRSY